jgi:ribosome-associated protein
VSPVDRDRDPAGGRRGDDEAVQEVAVRGESIRLGQFLKLADLVDTGADVKPLLADGDVRVNGEVETRRGRQLAHDDVVTVDAPAGVRTVRVGGVT